MSSSLKSCFSLPSDPKQKFIKRHIFNIKIQLPNILKDIRLYQTVLNVFLPFLKFVQLIPYIQKISAAATDKTDKFSFNFVRTLRILIQCRLIRTTKTKT